MANDQGRRAFLQLAAAAGGAGLLSSCSRDSGTSAAGAGASGTASTAGTTADGAASGVRAAAPGAARSPSPADWTALGRDLSGPLVRPGESSYTVSKRLFRELMTRAPWCTALDTGERRCLLGLMRKMLRSRGGR